MERNGALTLVVLATLIAVAAARGGVTASTSLHVLTYTPTPPNSGAAPLTAGSSPCTLLSPSPTYSSPCSPPAPSGDSPSSSSSSLVPDVPVDPYPPYTPDPSVPSNPTPSPSGTCTFWASNTQRFPDFLTMLTPVLDVFGGSAGSVFGSRTTLYEGLTSARGDAFGSLLRQGSAAVLNAYTDRQYAYSPSQVKSAFRAALVSPQAAAVQAVRFENANRGFVKRP